ncbi:ATP-grasp domain-containing protein [Clostridium cavendishii DSM 21758]|uniref:ATP-grasp domain-containing protein n=1 Tax=Clostridium cavendishii DSM 21758 TaxID=1121302 RepID=A0A1M6D794_9CLOT|nr:ATP-grasp domain-containing protein [Clostridium cavendishii]SHI69070.1 ATP-grasp domain-containing protein [Clostridium cavendishii DSM 21758]
MQNKDEYILVIGKLLEGNEIDIIKEFGYKTIVFNTELNLQQVFEADIPIEVNLNCDSSVINKALEVAEKYCIKSVFTLNEYRVPLAAKVRESLEIKYGIPYEAAINCRNKKNTRKILQQLKKGAVEYFVIGSIEEAEEVMKKLDFPIVVKPSNDAGSNMVFCCRKKSEVNDAINKISSTTKNSVGQILDKDILIEEFLDGPEFSVESYTHNGESKVIAITSKKILSPFNPIEVGHTVPAQITENENKEIEEVVLEALKLLKIDYAITHTEVKLTLKGPKIVEVNARPGGDKIPFLVKATTGYDLNRASFMLSLGKKVSCVSNNIVAKKADIRFFIADKNGTVGFDSVCKLYSNHNIKKVDIKISNGSKVTKTTSNYDRLGWFIAYDENDDVLNESMNFVNVIGSKCCK